MWHGEGSIVNNLYIICLRQRISRTKTVDDLFVVRVIVWAHSVGVGNEGGLAMIVIHPFPMSPYPIPIYPFPLPSTLLPATRGCGGQPEGIAQKGGAVLHIAVQVPGSWILEELGMSRVHLAEPPVGRQVGSRLHEDRGTRLVFMGRETLRTLDSQTSEPLAEGQVFGDPHQRALGVGDQVRASHQVTLDAGRRRSGAPWRTHGPYRSRFRPGCCCGIAVLRNPADRSSRDRPAPPA